MEKKILTEQSLYIGDVSMPKDFEINRKELAHYILHCKLTGEKYPHSRTQDMLTAYISENFNLKYKRKLIYKESWGDIYKPLQITPPISNVDPVDLKHSPDYTMLYGIEVEDCIVRIYYDDNRRKGRSWDIPLENNKFIIFPSSNTYYITNNQKDSLNFVQTITYDHTGR